MSRENEVWDVPGHADFLLKEVWDKPGFDRGRHAAVLQLTASYVTTDYVLDAGCGMGHFIPFLFKARPSVQYNGFDNSIEMLNKAREFFPELTDKLVMGDIYKMDDQPYSPTVVCIDILIHLPEIKSAIEEMWKHANKELIIVTRVASSSFLNKSQYSGQIVLPEGKLLINRADTRDDYLKIFNELPGNKTIDEKVYDDRSTLFRLTRVA